MAARFWVGGTGNWNDTAKWSATSGGAGGASVPTSADTVTIDTNSGVSAFTITVNVAANVATVNINSANCTLLLNNTFTAATSATLTIGAIDLNNQTMSTPIFSSSNSNVRSIAFGTSGKLSCTTATSNPLGMGVTTNFSYTGTSNISIDGAATTTNRIVQFGSTGGTEANAVNITVTAGSDTIDIYRTIKNLTLTNGFTGTVKNTLTRNIYGDLTLNSGQSWDATSAANTFVASSGTQKVTTAGVTITSAFTDSGDATLQLEDNYTTSSTFGTTQGPLNLNGKTLATTSFITAGAFTRTIMFANGTINVTGSGATAWNASGSNFTTSGTGTITMTSASAKTFVGNGFSYSATLNQGGAGALTIAGNNTFYDITATTLPSTITFTALTTQTVSQFTASGTAGNLLTLNSVTPGTRFTLSDSAGVNTVSHCSITDSIGTGGAVWQSLITDGNVNDGNNAGWIFTAIPVVYSQSTGMRLRSMAQRGRF